MGLPYLDPTSQVLPGENRCPETTLRVLVDLVAYAIVLPPQTDPPGTTPGRFSAVLCQSQTGRVWVRNRPHVCESPRVFLFFNPNNLCVFFGGFNIVSEDPTIKETS